MPRKRYQVQTKKSSAIVLNITSMTDMFTILLVFLLQSYSSAEVQVEMDQDIRLPASSTMLNPVNGVKITLTTKELKWDRKVIATLNNKDFAAADVEQSDQTFIKPLFEVLQKLNEEQKDKDKKITQILLQADAELPYGVLRKVFYTASMAGFPSLKMITTVGN